MTDKKTLAKKVVMLGDSSVGKTSLVRRFVQDIYDDVYVMTLGVKITKKVVCLEKVAREYTLMIWDIAGVLEYHRVPSNYYAGAAGGLMVCDITNRESLDNIGEWLTILEKHSGNVPIVLLVNKMDLKDQAQFSDSDIRESLEGHEFPYLYTSAKDGTNVELAFNKLTEFMASRRAGDDE